MENHNVPIVPNEIPGTSSINGYVSGITEELVSPKMPTRSPTATEIGRPPTSEQNHNLFVNEKLNGEGYQMTSLDQPEILMEWKRISILMRRT